MEYRQHFRDLRRHPGMYVSGVLTFTTLAAYVTGFDAGTDGRALDGFQQYLVLRLDDGDPLGWPTLVIRLTLPASGSQLLSPDEDAAAVASLFDCLDDFFTRIGRTGEGRADIRREHQLWLQRHTWYSLDVERFGAQPRRRIGWPCRGGRNPRDNHRRRT